MEHISQYLTVKNSVHQLPALERRRTSDEGRFEDALESSPIRFSPLEELKKVLRLVMVKIGLRENNWPTNEEKQILLSHIIENLGGNKIDEIKLAFEMAMSGKLDVEVNCYENFSCLYFSQIMMAYREWSAQVYIQNKLQPKSISYVPPMWVINLEYAMALRIDLSNRLLKPL